MMQAITKQRSVHDMDEIKPKAPLRLPALPALQRTPLLADAAAFALLGGGGYLALRIMGLVFRLCGVD